MVLARGLLPVALLALLACCQQQRDRDPPAAPRDPAPAQRSPVEAPRIDLPVLDRSALSRPEGWKLVVDEEHGVALAHPEALNQVTPPGTLPLVLDDGARGAALLVAQARDSLPPGLPFGGGQQDLVRVMEFLRGRQTLRAAPGALDYYGLSGEFSVEKVASPRVGPFTGEELRLQRELPCAEKGSAECEQLLVSHARLVLVRAGPAVWQLWTYSDDATVAERRGAQLASLLANVRFFRAGRAEP